MPLMIFFSRDADVATRRYAYARRLLRCLLTPCYALMLLPAILCATLAELLLRRLLMIY